MSLGSRIVLALALAGVSSCGAHRGTAQRQPDAVRVPSLLAESAKPVSPPSPRARSERLELVLDVSGSMFMLAERELAPPGATAAPRRFDLAKEAAIELIRRRPEDVVGAVLYGKSALKLEARDLVAAIQKLEPGVIDGMGSDFTGGVVTALSELRHTDAAFKRVVVLTDGNVDHGSLDPSNTAALAKSLDAPIVVLQLGNLEQTTVQSGVDLFGAPVYARATVPIDHELLANVTRDSGGELIVVTDRAGFERALARLGEYP